MSNTLRTVSLSVVLFASSVGCAARVAPSAVTATAAPPVACAGGVVHDSSDLAKYASCDSVVGDLSIRATDFTRIDALARLRSVSGSLVISDNSRLADLRGLEQLGSVGSLEIARNAELTELDALSHLERANEVSISDNAELRSLHGLEGLTALGSLSIDHNGLYHTRGLDQLRTVGSLSVKHNSKLISLAGLRRLEQAKSVEIRGNRVLAAYYGLLPQLKQVDERLVLRSNDGLAEREVREVLARVGHGNGGAMVAQRAADRELSMR